MHRKSAKQAINEFFESIWKLYPSKKGKGQISDSKKKVLYNIGYDELSRAIERYKAGLAKVNGGSHRMAAPFSIDVISIILMQIIQNPSR